MGQVSSSYHNLCLAPASIIIEELNIQRFKTVMLPLKSLCTSSQLLMTKDTEWTVELSTDVTVDRSKSNGYSAQRDYWIYMYSFCFVARMYFFQKHLLCFLIVCRLYDFGFLWITQICLNLIERLCYHCAETIRGDLIVVNYKLLAQSFPTNLDLGQPPLQSQKNNLTLN